MSQSRNINKPNRTISLFAQSINQSNDQRTIDGYTKNDINKLNIRFSQHQLSKNQQNLICNDSNTYGYQKNVQLYNRWLDKYSPKLHEFNVNLTVCEDAAVVLFSIC